VPELVINVSNIISPLCYTVLRIEPYSICPYRCIYCYSKWYLKRKSNIIIPRRKAVKMFEGVAKRIYRIGAKPIPFRLSTLVEPFPPHEELNRISERVLNIAKQYEYPLIVNTKSVKVVEIEDVKKILEELLDKGLAVLQLSLSTLDDNKSRVLEPLAPPPSRRLSIVKEFGSRGMPVVIRLSPFIPFYSPTSEEEIKFALGIFKDIGVKHLIVEALRIEREAVEALVKELKVYGLSFEGYSIREVEGLKPLVRVSERLRIEAYTTLHRYAVKNGMGFATCKEGLFRFHTTDDCCGAYMLRNYALRVTLWDFYRAGIIVGKQEVDAETSITSICKKFSRICSEMLLAYPRAISKHLKYHEKRLLKVLRKPELLKHIAPDIINNT
jgi:DNA repair photolyase